MEKIKKFFNKIFSLSLNVKLRILYSFLFIFIVIIGLITCFNTYSEPTIAFKDDEDYIESQILENVVYVNDLEMDLNYYKGANYTYNDGTLPTVADKNIYNETNLAQLKITYSGWNKSRTLHGYVSITEAQDTYIYFKAYPVNNNGTDATTDDYVLIELIDNPFTNRPTDKGFNGWITDYSGAILSYDNDYYVRYAKLPVTYSDGKPNAIEIDFYAVWIDATVAAIETSNNQVWSNAFSNLKDKQMTPVETTIVTYPPLDMTGYYYQITIDWNSSCNGYYDDSGVLQNNCSCRSWRGCTYYELIDGDTFNVNNTYYELSRTMQEVDNEQFAVLTVNPEYINANMASYYKLVHLARGESYEGYYDSTGNNLGSGTCNTNNGCDYYELMQYYKADGTENIINENDEYYYLVTRDTNIVVLQYNLSYTWASAQDKPFTFTGAYNGTNYGRMWTVTNRQVQIYNDTTIENMIIYTANNYSSDYEPPLSATSGSIFANFKNLKIGRGILPNSSYNRPCFRSVVGGIGSTGSNGNPTKYRLIVESGMYNSMSMVKGSSTSSTNNIYALAQAIYGNDYDRVNENNENLEIYYTAAGSFSGRIYASTNSTTSTEVAMDLIVKSGSFGTGKYDYTTGIYVGGLTGGTHYAAKRAKIEGGWIYNLIGGPLTYNGRGSVNDVYMNITGGSIDMIIGGAGRSATYGNRIISVTGGTINYSVFGGSNSYSGSGDDGTLVGTPFIYIGGDATIGNEDYVNANNTLWNAEAGSVFGIGNGKTGTSTIGSADNSNIIIDGKATILRNIYGGGNFGATGVSSNVSTTTSNILINGGFIAGDVYGGGNRNGSGDNNTKATINITMNAGNVVGSIYGGSNELGTIYGDVNVKVLGGEVTNNVYGGGRGGYQSNNEQGTFVSQKVDVEIGKSDVTGFPIVNGSVYGGSAFGTVNGSTRTTNLSSYPTTVTVNNGIIGNVFGGGQGDSEYTPYVEGNITVTINNGDINNVYGGNDASGSPNGSITVYLNGGTVDNTFGGGRATDAKTTNVYLQGGTSTNIFGGSDTSGIVNTSNVTCTSGTATTVYGGNNLGGSTGTTNVTINGGDITTVYGGGEKTDVTTAANVTLRSEVTTLFGGSNTEGTVTESNILVENGTVENIYGGNNDGGTTITTTMDINGITAGNVYGGGKKAPTTTSTINFASGTANNLFGGGSEAGVETTNVNLKEATIGNVYGGSDMSGNVTTSNIKTYGENITDAKLDIGKLYGGNNAGGVTTTANIDLDHGTFDEIYGGGKSAITGTSDVNVESAIINDNFFGGGDAASITSVTAVITSSTIGSADSEGNVYGGGNDAAVDSTISLTIGGNTTIHGNVYGGGNNGSTGGTITTDIKNTTIAANAYGGGNNGDALSDVSLSFDTVSVNAIYGGGNNADVGGKIDLIVHNATVNDNIYGGGNVGVTEGTITTDIKNTTVTNNIYGGGNNGDVGDDVTLTIDSTSLTTVYGGGNKAGVDGNITLTIKNETEIKDSVYGGGNEGVTTGSVTTAISDTAVTNNIYGGGNNGNVGQNVTLTIDTISVNAIYGGGNNADVGGNIELTIDNATVNDNIYGGGNVGITTGSITTDIKNTTVTDNIYGGGNNGDVGDDVTLSIDSTSLTTVYGGGNNASVDGDIILTITSESEIKGSVYGGGNEGVTTGSITTEISDTTITNNVFGGGNNGNVGSDVTLSIDSTTLTTVYGGGNNADVGGNIALTISNNSEIKDSVYGGGNEGETLGGTTSTLTDVVVTNSIYGGGNKAGVGSSNSVGAKLSLTSVTACDVYGGGRSAITNGNTEVTIKDSTINCNVFAGGNGEESVVVGDATGELNPAKVTGNASVLINGTTTVGKSVYGGGNLGFVLGNAGVTVITTDVGESIYGGGNAARVKGSTTVKITSTEIGQSLYAGGNGVTAIVEGSTNLTVDGSTKVGQHVFGGGNAAATGLEANNNSTGIVNIVGLEVEGNVYGGANTSVLYGATTLNIGTNAVNNPDLIVDDIIIKGTVFGGGEANASGSEVYDYSFISVTVGIQINIDGAGHDNFSIGGSIFGSGNASSTTGYSYINISNYGSEDNVQSNISIQRANIVSLSNSYIKLSGATDRTNEYSDVLFTLSRIDELKLKNNSVLYLKTGSNLLKKFSSLVDINGKEEKATVTIDDENKTVVRNVNNRLYLLEDKNLNVALNEKITSYGDVYGMTFFGMYRENSAGKIITALYSNDYGYGDTVTGGDAYYFTSGSYVLGRHYESHDITVDGFYSNDLVSEESTELKVFYIEPTPADADFYMWVVGEQVVTYDITLTASKYSTLGVDELSLINYSKPNTSFSILGFNYDGLVEGASLVESSDIPRIADSATDADMKMGLAMQTGQSGWITIGNTEFLSNESTPIVGTKLYQKENSNLAPSFLFYLYHSKNIATEGQLGTVSISLVAITPIDDLNNEVERININVTLTRALYNTTDYEATMTTGKKYSMFASSVVDITSTSSLSAYYSLFIEKETNPYRTGDYRTLVSTYVLPVNTKITMIDFDHAGLPTYYYYVVSSSDYASALQEFNTYGEATYNLSKFIKMGSTSADNNYDDSEANILYYNEEQGLSMEEFIFIVDFKESNITEDVTNNSLLIELRNINHQTIVSVLGIEQADMVYDLYYDSDAVIELDASLSTEKFYNGKNFAITVNTNFIQQKVLSNQIVDTNYYDQKLGTKISIYDSYGNRLTSTSLMGIYFETNGVKYYPRDNGEVRINIAERVANVTSKITVHAENSNLAGGVYKIVIESFGSPDGIYYGLESSDSIELSFIAMDTLYGLIVNIPDTALFWDKETGKNSSGSNTLLATVKYESGLSDPNIRVKMYRRDYEEVYSTEYNLVDFGEYFSNRLTPTTNEFEYYLSDNPVSSLTHFLYLKENLISGTYKLEFILYDGDTYIGEVHRYIIIKKLAG